MAVINNIPEGFPTYSVGTIAYVDSDGDLHMNVPALQILVSDENDLTGLDVPVGSVAFTADESSKWRLGSDGSWEEVSTSGGGGGGGNAGMVFEMKVVEMGENPVVTCYESEDNMSDIASAFTSGKNVVLHFPEIQTMGYNEVYLKILGYGPDSEYISISNLSELSLTYPHVENGKLIVMLDY